MEEVSPQQQHPGCSTPDGRTSLPLPPNNPNKGQAAGRQALRIPLLRLMEAALGPHALAVRTTLVEAFPTFLVVCELRVCSSCRKRGIAMFGNLLPSPTLGCPFAVLCPTRFHCACWHPTSEAPFWKTGVRPTFAPPFQPKRGEFRQGLGPLGHQNRLKRSQSWLKTYGLGTQTGPRVSWEDITLDPLWFLGFCRCRCCAGVRRHSGIRRATGRNGP